MPPRVAIIGAGFSGIGTAIKLREAGVRDIALFDRGDRVGGTWRENTYPGAACDIPSHLYSFSFEPRPDWSRRFPPQHEVLEYLEGCVRKYGLTEHLRLGTEVAGATFDEERGTWTLALGSDGQTHECDVLVAGTGQLSRPAYPLLPGIDEFDGVAFHSGQWRHDHDLRGRDVAVIGTGASAIQFVPAIAPDVRRLTVFQRSAPYVIPKVDREYGAVHRRLFASTPLPRLARLGFFAYFEGVTPGFIGTRPRAILPLSVSHQALLRWQVRDPELREKLTPDYGIGCKRVLVSNDWYPALQRPNVEVVTDRIRSIASGGIVVEGGRNVQADTIIYGTGFAANDFLAPMAIHGLGGRELNEVWREGAEAYLGMTVAGFPNLFILYGPNTNLGSGSIIYMLESQIRYVVDACRRLESERAAYLDVKPDVQERFSREISERMRQTVWQTGCTSWYVTQSGRNTNNWPGHMLEYRRRTRKIAPGDYRLARST